MQCTNQSPTNVKGAPSKVNNYVIFAVSKGSAMTNMPAGVPSLVGAQYTIVGQGGVPYIQQPPVYYEDFQLMQQQRLPPHIVSKLQCAHRVLAYILCPV